MPFEFTFCRSRHIQTFLIQLLGFYVFSSYDEVNLILEKVDD
jgi:hypothetical protein